MPEPPFPPKARAHPWRRAAEVASAPPPSPLPGDYAELQATSCFTFLVGASHPEELVEQAAALGVRAIAVTDRNTLAGVVRAHVAAKACALPLLVGTRLDLLDAPSVLLHATDLAAYGAICRLITLGRRRAPKGACHLELHDLLAALGGPGGDGLLVTALSPADLDGPCLAVLAALREASGPDALSIAASMLGRGRDAERLADLARLSEHLAVPLVATNDVHHHVAARRALQDVVTCIRHGCTLAEAGGRLWPNAERRIKSPAEMARLFAAHPEAVRRSVELAERAAAFSLDELRYRYPGDACPAGTTPLAHLRACTEAGAHRRYPNGIPEKVRDRIDHELALIADLRYEHYFLTVHDIVSFARRRGILCQGRGAAANSAVCYCLGLTSVDPDRVELLFERFVSRERDEPPDIDIDFEHERREEVLQYVYERYGRDRAALAATVISYRGRSAVREVGKVLGLSLDCVDRLAKNVDWWSDRVANEDRIRELGLDPDDPVILRAITLAEEIIGFPRHLSQHVGGFVITEGPLHDLVPVQNAAMEDRTVIEWDKDDLDAMGLLKIDLLGLGMLTCVRKAFDLIERHEDRPLALATVPAEDPDVYDMICRADTVGVFQIESRAQMTMLPRLRPRCWYDLVIEVAIVRPGPIQGDMVHPYLRRRQGLDPVAYPSEAVRGVLERTLGVPLFQEQAMSLAMVAAGFTAGEADQLRRAMAAWKRRGNAMERFGRKLIAGMTERGYERDFAERVFSQLKGFSEYGFPESHAASFALIVYVSCWLKHHYPSVFATALINSQPMGFYAPAQIVRDARDHGVEVRPVDVNFSAWDCRLESVPLHETTGRPDARRAPVRLGLRLVKGLAEDHARMVDRAVRERGPFHSVAALWRASGVPLAAMRALARADAFGSMGLDRQAAQWRLQSLRDDPMPLFDGPVRPVAMTPEIAPPPPPEPPPAEDAGEPETAPDYLPPVSDLTRVLQDYAATALSLREHPMAFLRAELEAEGVTPNGRLADEAEWPHGRWIVVSGISLVRQRPATASGVVFITLEDETGIANLIVRPSTYERYRRAARHGVLLRAHGTVEREGTVVHVMTRRIESLDGRLAGVRARSRDFR